MLDKPAHRTRRTHGPAFGAQAALVFRPANNCTWNRAFRAKETLQILAMYTTIYICHCDLRLAMTRSASILTCAVIYGTQYQPPCVASARWPICPGSLNCMPARSSSASDSRQRIGPLMQEPGVLADRSSGIHGTSARSRDPGNTVLAEEFRGRVTGDDRGPA